MYDNHGKSFRCFYKGRFTWSPKSPVTWGQSVQPQLLQIVKVGTYHFTGVPSPKSQVWHGCLHDNTFWRSGLGLVLGVGSSKKLDPSLNTSLAIFLHKIIKIRFLRQLTILEWFLEAQKLGLGLHVGTCWHEWDSGLGTPCEPALIISSRLMELEGLSCQAMSWDTTTRPLIFQKRSLQIQLQRK